MTKTVNLALQGGGAHGAFTWGVLDRLLEEERLEIEAISGTSAGAMNAAMLKTGLVTGGRDGAKAQLDRFWRVIRRQSGRNANPVSDWMALFSPDAADLARSIMGGPAYQLADTWSRTLSPYDWNPLNINPLRDLLEDLIEWEAVCQDCRPYLHISATNVRTGKIEVFDRTALCVESLLASACLPTLFQAVEIDGESYWDGGFMGNPALYPLYRSSTADIVIVHINPLERTEIPRTASEIQNRVNEISFNSSLLRELRAIDFVHRLLADGKLGKGEKREILVHSIRDDETMTDLSVATKLVPDPAQFDQLKAAGRAAAETFLKDNWSKIGRKSSVDLRAMFS